MNNRLLFMSAALATVLSYGIAFAENPGAASSQSSIIKSIDLPVIQVDLKQGPGVDKTSTLCNICHSVDYITMQPLFSRAQWTGTVNKMVKVLGAPITDDDAKTITDYLSTSYGNGK
jgi:sulfite dehydrogenase (cytochrome) subunit B